MFEIYWSHNHSELLVEDLQGSTALSKMPLDFINRCDSEIEKKYPELHNRLADLHGGLKANAFARVKQFFACNFSFKDGQADIDEDFNFIIESVPCPARTTGICEFCFCNPKLNTVFSEREKEVLVLFKVGLDEAEIGEKLFISKHTVHNHINNMYAKAGLTNQSHPDRRLIEYAHSKKII